MCSLLMAGGRLRAGIADSTNCHALVVCVDTAAGGTMSIRPRSRTRRQLSSTTPAAVSAA